MLRHLGAVETGRRRRVVFQPFEFDINPATDAMSELALVNSLQGRVDALDFDGAPAFGFQLHGLGLKGIHPGQAPDHGLIKFHRLPRFLGNL